MEDFGAYRHLQQHGGFGARLFLDILDDPRAVVMAAPADFLGDIPDFDHMSDRLRLGYERAAACPADDDTRRLQLAKRPVCRHARDVEMLDQKIGRATVCNQVPNEPLVYRP